MAKFYMVKHLVKSAKANIKAWENEITEAKKSLKAEQEKLALLKEQCEFLPTLPCPFCKATMVDTSSLKEWADIYEYGSQEEKVNSCFGWCCYECSTYETTPAKPETPLWTRDSLSSNSKTFAATVLDHFPAVECIGLEGAAGRGWLLLTGGTWFANKNTKGDLIRMWNCQ